MTIRNKELHRLFIILGIFLSIIVLLFSLIVSAWLLVCILLVAVIMSKTTGVEFDIENRKYRKYDHFFFKTSGEWKEIGENKELVILVKRGVQTTAGTMMTASLKTRGGFSELYLMNENHTGRFFIHSSENHKSIVSLAKELSQSLNIEVKPYKPMKR